MQTIPTIVLALTLASTVTAAEEPSWLPSTAVEGLSGQLATRMKQIGLGPGGDDEKLLAGARQMVLAMRDDVERRGEDGLAELAPTFAGFELPSAGQRELDLMSRYNVCNLVLFLQFSDPAFADDVNARLTSTLGLTAMTMVIVYLRDPFVGAGNDPARIEAHLTDPRLQPVFDRIQRNVDLRDAVEKTCQPVVAALLEKPLAQLGE